MSSVRFVPGDTSWRQQHARKFTREALRPALTHHAGPSGAYRDPTQVARERLHWIFENHHPQPLEARLQRELQRILAAADKEIGGAAG